MALVGSSNFIQFGRHLGLDYKDYVIQKIQYLVDQLKEIYEDDTEKFLFAPYYLEVSDLLTHIKSGGAFEVDKLNRLNYIHRHSLAYKEHPEILLVHHKQLVRRKRADKMSSFLANNWGIESMKEELKKCLLLCPNCHAWFHCEEHDFNLF